MISPRVVSTPSRGDPPKSRRPAALRVLPAEPAADAELTHRPDYDTMSIPELCRVILDADAPRQSRDR